MGREKLEQKTIDFDRVDQAGLKDGKWDVVFIAFVSLFRISRLCMAKRFALKAWNDKKARRKR